MKNKTKSVSGKRGAEKRWASRYEILIELSKLCSKEMQNELIKWPTRYLKHLLDVYRAREDETFPQADK